MRRRSAVAGVRALALGALAAASLGCPARGGGAARTVVLATTTSVEDSGLLDVLVRRFEAAHPGWRLRAVAVGTGQALALGGRKDADVLLVHAPDAELAFMREGHGLERRPAMRNAFVIVGPPEDPAGVRAARDAPDAFARIARAAVAEGGGRSAPEARPLAPSEGQPSRDRPPVRFVSRGDDSGTHRKERALWREAGVAPAGEWYADAGQGMGEVLTIADEMGAYTLADRSTYLALRSALRLAVLFEGDPRLDNPYHVILVAGARNPAGARAFADWLTGPEGQAAIAEFGTERFARPLFEPAVAPDAPAPRGDSPEPAAVDAGSGAAAAPEARP